MFARWRSDSAVSQRAVSSAEGRLQLEQERFRQQLERLELENEELRRATKAKTDKIASLKAQLEGRTTGAQAARGGAVSART